MMTCNLAPDKLTSFMLLPFHRRWYINRSIESEDQAIGSLNCSILERAPCSIGILVEGRRHLKCSNSRDTSSSESSSYSISVVFLGGKDDREAVVLGKRISQDQRVSLTVIHLKPTNRLGAILADSDRMLDDEMLRGVKESGYIRDWDHWRPAFICRFWWQLFCVDCATTTKDYLRPNINDVLKLPSAFLAHILRMIDVRLY
ncbi:hypothetical protein POUND7_010137 [Theobroma cacao]